MSDARKKIQAARTALVLDQPFFGSLALRLRVVEDPGCGTAWTDGQSMGYDPAFIETLTHEEIVGLVAHEVMHCANGHPWRRDGRDGERWNVACDYAINYVLDASKFVLPKGALKDAQYDGKSSEWIYDRVPKQPPSSGRDKASKGQGSGQKRPGAGACDVRDAPSAGAESGVSEGDWQQAVQQAAEAAKMRGELPAHLERYAREVVKPRVDWRSVLRRFVQSAAKEDYNWTRPSPRYMARGLYLPSLRSEAMGPIAVAIDTSGSIDQVTLDQFAAELNAVVSEARPERTVVIYCDAQVHRVDEFDREDVIELKPVGGGGTSHVPVMDTVDAMDDPPVCLICLTDLYTEHRPEPPAMPVLWATIGEQSAPYGEIVSLER